MLQRSYLILVLSLIIIHAVRGQSLKEQINNMFGEVLKLELSPGEHGEHFLPTNVATSQAIINSMNNFIGTSIASIPLSSSAAGVTFDFSSGKPVPTSPSLQRFEHKTFLHSNASIRRLFAYPIERI